MKSFKKALVLCLCAALLVAASVLGTMAYLTSTDEVKNTFTVGNVAITLDEAKVGDNGKALTGEQAERVKANEYHLLPGHTYDKDPTVTVKAGSETSYVRMLVTISNAKELKEVFGEGFKPEEYVVGWDNSIWPCVSMTIDATANTIICEFRYKETVTPEKKSDTVLDDLFETITVPGTVTNEQLAKLENLKIDVIAQAIQADGFETVDKAWEAFPTTTTTSTTSEGQSSGE